MIVADIPQNEKFRIQALRDLNILDTPADLDYDQITDLASYICNVPVSLITLVDEKRQWFKSKKGLAPCETTRDSSFCAHAILEPRTLMEIPDARKDLRFIDNPLTKLEEPVIFYAGIPLLTQEGLPLGSLCVIDHKPNKLNAGQKEAMLKLGKQVERLFELRMTNSKLTKTQAHLANHNESLKDFAATVSHDLKMPLANLILTSDILKKKYGPLLDAKGVNYLAYLKRASMTMSTYITNILSHYESVAYERDDAQEFAINDLLEEIVDLLDIKFDCEVHLPENNIEVRCNMAALKQIFLNLIGNSLKYNDKEHTIISIAASETATRFKFTIRDNGRGIEKDKVSSIFKLFCTIGHLDRDGNLGHGIGLSTVQKLVEELGGSIKVASKLGDYTEFSFSIEK